MQGRADDLHAQLTVYIAVFVIVRMRYPAQLIVRTTVVDPKVAQFTVKTVLLFNVAVGVTT